MSSRNTHRWWLLVPFVWQAALAPWSNGVHWQPFGLPFPMAWQMAGIVVTSAVLWWVFRYDQALAVKASPSTAKLTHDVTP